MVILRVLLKGVTERSRGGRHSATVATAPCLSLAASTPPPSTPSSLADAVADGDWHKDDDAYDEDFEDSPALTPPSRDSPSAERQDEDEDEVPTDTDSAQARVIGL
ncbi:Protein of unknown function [Gryllus bimaculatus]|nr:Protein of unknown function [Gryllus bimaculatus]